MTIDNIRKVFLSIKTWWHQSGFVTLIPLYITDVMSDLYSTYASLHHFLTRKQANITPVPGKGAGTQPHWHIIFVFKPSQKVNGFINKLSCWWTSSSKSFSISISKKMFAVKEFFWRWMMTKTIALMIGTSPSYYSFETNYYYLQKGTSYREIKNQKA